MNSEQSPAADRRPAGSQFSLRGLFALLTATSVILAILALVIKSPLHWLGALFVPVICITLIGVMELGRRLFPPPAKRYLSPKDLATLPGVPFPPPRPTDYADGGCPFGPMPAAGPESANVDKAKPE
ncbi:MAG TPA: hypothetical protein VFB80_00170 [Pirellulaceae bacterium]|nr:hypothetical protein [Pirellulaceae bacterium]